MPSAELTIARYVSSLPQLKHLVGSPCTLVQLLVKTGGDPLGLVGIALFLECSFAGE